MRRNGLVIAFAILFAAVALAIAGVNLYTDWLWFQEVHYGTVFATILKTRVMLGLCVGAGMFILLAVNIFMADFLSRTGYITTAENVIELPGIEMLAGNIRALLLGGAALMGLLVGIEASMRWESYLVYVHGVAFGKPFDPVFGNDISFYVFKLPFVTYIYQLLLMALMFGIILAAVVYAYKRGIVLHERGVSVSPTVFGHLSVLLALWFGLKAAGYRLSAYDMLFTSRGFVLGMGYTDVHVRLPMLNVLLVVSLVAAGIVLVNIMFRGWKLPAAAALLLIVTSTVGWGYPEVMQRFKVTPNEKNLELEYIQRQIEFTRQAYGIVKEKDVLVRPFAARKNLLPAEIDANETIIRNIRLWDPRPLLNTYQQLQGIRPYYRFASVNMDRYVINGEYKQITIAPRELDYERLPDKSWINQRFSYTHGFGLVASPVTDIAEEGRPNMILRDIPPVSETDLTVTQPRVYFGELSNDYIFVNSSTRAIDYPEGGGNKKAHYDGKAGIRISSLGRRLSFALRFSSKDIIFNNNINSKTRILIHRNIIGDGLAVPPRAAVAMPLLQYDGNPYLVITDSGRMKWIQDAYTMTDRYPYAELTRERDKGVSYNYIRNSVKVVIDAYDGSIDYYVIYPQDPIIKTYMKIFPGVFKNIEDMPEDLKEHIRYPVSLFQRQAEVYSVYQMDDPSLFYEKEDRWNLPDEQFHDQKQPMEPYYTVTRLPDEAEEEFILMLPFTPKDRENMSAWMAARNDYKKGMYGKLIVYKFPAQQKNIYGPMQIEARIMQKEEIAEQIGWWKRETNVIRGNLLVIPIEDSLMYVEPIYLKAKTSEIPELKRVVVAIGDDIAMDETLAGAIRKVMGAPVLENLHREQVAMLAGDAAPQPAEVVGEQQPGQDRTTPALPSTRDALKIAEDALQALQKAKQDSADWNWQNFGENLGTVERDLKTLIDEMKKMQPDGVDDNLPEPVQE
jgi:hypothetical protein